MSLRRRAVRVLMATTATARLTGAGYGLVAGSSVFLTEDAVYHGLGYASVFGAILCLGFAWILLRELRPRG